MKRTSLLGVVRMVFRVFRVRPMKLILMGVAIFIILQLIQWYYNLPEYIRLISLFIGFGIIVLGIFDMAALAMEREQAEEEEEEEAQDSEDIKKELSEIKKRL
ncbi:MAG: hypothetical protein KKA79_00445, partial [Nanoarchaeota archaeon]|nr:hypothetical protein [Nanoarchaeota archaeon]